MTNVPLTEQELFVIEVALNIHYYNNMIDDNGKPNRKDWFTEQNTVGNGGINDERI